MFTQTSQHLVTGSTAMLFWPHQLAQSTFFFLLADCVRRVYSICLVANQLVIIILNLANSAFLSSPIISAFEIGFIGLCTKWKVQVKMISSK